MKIVYPSWFELQFNDNNGKPLSSGRVYTKRSDSGANAITYNANDAPNSNPVLLDPNGRAVIRLDNTFAYKFIVHDSNDVLVYERDKVYGTEVVVDGGSGTDDHAALSNREANNQHPISAITDLESELNDKVSKSTTTTQTMVGGLTLDYADNSAELTNKKASFIDDNKTRIELSQDETESRVSSISPNGLNTITESVKDTGTRIEGNSNAGLFALDAQNDSDPYLLLQRNGVGQVDMQSDRLKYDVGANNSILDAIDLKFNGVSIFTTFLSAVSATLQFVYDKGAQIVTSVANGAVKLRRGTGADSDSVLEVQDGSGLANFTVRGNGVIVSRSSLPMRAESLATSTDPRETRTEIRGQGVGATGINQKFYNRFCASTDKGFDAGLTSSSTFGNNHKFRIVPWAHSQDASSTIDTATTYFEMLNTGDVNLSGKLSTPASTTTRAGFNIAQGVLPTTPANGDIVPTVDGLFARISGVTEQMTPVGYGEIHVHDSAVAQSIPTGTTYQLITNWTDNGVSLYTTPDAVTNKRITVAKAGVYQVMYNCSMISGTNNTTFFVSGFKNGTTELDNMHFSRKIGTGADVGSAGFSGLVSLSANDYIDVRIRHDQIGSVNFTQVYACLSLQRIG